MKRSVHVLLIEDDPDDVVIVRESLQASDIFDFSLACVDRLALGLDALEKSRFDVVLLDLSLPDSQGIDTFVELFSFRVGVPIIILTGLHDNEMALRMMRLGAQGYLVKGRDNLDMLPLAIQYALEQYYLLKETQFNRLWEKHEHEMQALLARWTDAAPAPPAEEMIRTYQSIVEHLPDGNDGIHRAVNPLVDQLADAHAGPAEVLALHLAALKGLCEVASIRQANVYVDAGQTLLTLILGELLQRNRAHAMETPTV